MHREAEFPMFGSFLPDAVQASVAHIHR
jgi:hypothetical protein